MISPVNFGFIIGAIVSAVSVFFLLAVLLRQLAVVCTCFELKWWWWWCSQATYCNFCNRVSYRVSIPRGS